MNVPLEPSWKKALAAEFEKSYFTELTTKVRDAYLSDGVFPPTKLIFNSLELCPFDSVRVVILGQDPYHGPGQAHGLSFSVPEGVRIPPRLKIYTKNLLTTSAKTFLILAISSIGPNKVYYF